MCKVNIVEIVEKDTEIKEKIGMKLKSLLQGCEVKLFFFKQYTRNVCQHQGKGPPKNLWKSLNKKMEKKEK